MLLRSESISCSLNPITYHRNYLVIVIRKIFSSKLIILSIFVRSSLSFFQTRLTIWTSTTSRPRIIPLISTTWWTCPSPWRMTRRSCQPSATSWPPPCRTLPPTSGSGSGPSSTKSLCPMSQLCLESKDYFCFDFFFESADQVTKFKVECRKWVWDM